MTKRRFNRTIIICLLVSLAGYILYKALSNIFFLFAALMSFIALIVYFFSYNKKVIDTDIDIKDKINKIIEDPKTVFDNLIKEYNDNILFNKFNDLKNLKLYETDNFDLVFVFIKKNKKVYANKDGIVYKKTLYKYSTIDDFINKINELMK